MAEQYVQMKQSAVFLFDQCGSAPQWQGCLRVSGPTHSRGDITTHYCYVGGIALPKAQSQGTPTPFTPTVEAPMQILWSWFARRCPFTMVVAYKTCQEGWEIAQWDENIDYAIYFPDARITDEGFATNLTQGMDDASDPVGATVTLHVSDWQLYEKHTPGKLATLCGRENVTAMAYCGGPLCTVLSGSCNQPYDPGCDDIWAGGEGGELCLSVDGGTTWIDKSGEGAGQLDLSDALYGQMDVLALYCDRGVVLVSAEDGCIYYSHDGGASWTAPADCSQMAVAFGSYFKTIWAAGNGLWKSTDDGVNWTQVLPGAFVGVYFNEDGYGVAITATDTYFSFDGGASWLQLTASGLTAQAAVQMVNGSIWVAGGDGMAYTLDQGESWTTIDTGSYSDMLWLSCFVGYRIFATVPASGYPLQYTIDGGDSWWNLPISGHSGEDLNVLAGCYDRLMIGGEGGFLAELVTKSRMTS